MSYSYLHESLRRAVIVMFVYSVGALGSAIAMWPHSTIMTGVWVAIFVVTFGCAVAWASSLRGSGADDDD